MSLFLSLSLSLSDGDSTDDVTVDGLELIIWVAYKALSIVTDKIKREKTRHNLNGRDYNLISGRGTHPHGGETVQGLHGIYYARETQEERVIKEKDGGLCAAVWLQLQPLQQKEPAGTFIQKPKLSFLYS